MFILDDTSRDFGPLAAMQVCHSGNGKLLLSQQAGELFQETDTMFITTTDSRLAESQSLFYTNPHVHRFRTQLIKLFIHPP
jgi:hypothetical protein